MIEIRPVSDDDRQRIMAFLHGLSLTTMHRRFFSVPKVDDRLVDFVAHPSECCSEALVALEGDDVVGVASYDRLADDPTGAELAVVVGDDWQRHGVGRLLTRRLAKAALVRGIERFVATTLPENDAVRSFVHSTAPQASWHLEGRELALELPLGRSSAA